MIWQILTERKRPKRGGKKDLMDGLIEAIEKFAPREHRSNRELFFYNYRILEPYPKPLQALLETILQWKDLGGAEPSAFYRELFLKLKTFYDPKNKLTQAEAAQDWGLKRKFSELLLFFYGKKAAAAKETETWINGMRL